MPCLPCEKALVCGEESRSQLKYIGEVFKAIQENRIKNLFTKEQERAIINDLGDVEKLTKSIWKCVLQIMNEELGEEYAYRPKE